MSARIRLRQLTEGSSVEDIERAIDVYVLAFGSGLLNLAFNGYDLSLARPGAEAMIRGALIGGGEVWVAGLEDSQSEALVAADGDASIAVDAVAIWFGPGTSSSHTEAQRSLRHHLVGSRMSEKGKRWFSEDLKKNMKILAERCLGEHPDARDLASWHLSILATHPDKQSKGLGSALVRVGLAKADDAGAEAILNTHSSENVSFYERLGFAVAGDPVTIPLDGGESPMWCLTRSRITTSPRNTE